MIAPTLSSTASSDSQAQRRLRSVSEIWPAVSGGFSATVDGLSETSASLNEGGSVLLELALQRRRGRAAPAPRRGCTSARARRRRRRAGRRSRARGRTASARRRVGADEALRLVGEDVGAVVLLGVGVLAQRAVLVQRVVEVLGARRRQHVPVVPALGDVAGHACRTRRARRSRSGTCRCRRSDSRPPAATGAGSCRRAAR